MSTTIVQSAPSGENVAFLAWPSDVTSGNLLIVVLGIANTNVPFWAGVTLADTLGSSYARAVLYQDSPGFNNGVAIYFAVAPSSGPNTVTVSGGFGGSASQIAVAELTGTFTTDIDQTGGGRDVAPTLALTQVNDIVFTATYYQDNETASATSPEVLLTNSIFSDRSMALSWELVASTGSFTSSLALTAGNPHPSYVSVAFASTPLPGPIGVVQQAIVEFITLPSPDAVVQQAIVEFVTLNNPNARIQQAVIEFITLPPVPTPVPPTSNPATTGGYPFGIPPLGTCRPINKFDLCEMMEAIRMRKIKFPPSCVMPTGVDPYTMPWDEDYGSLPEQSIPFNKTGAVLTPNAVAGDVTVLSFRVPAGYDGLLTACYWGYTGTGFLQGSGDLIFRLLRNQVYLKDLSNVPYAIGSSKLPAPMTQGALLLSGQLVSLIVNAPNVSGNIQVGDSNIYGGLIGFWWPRG
jgi:hypothetical protein